MTLFSHGSSFPLPSLSSLSQLTSSAFSLYGDWATSSGLSLGSRQISHPCEDFTRSMKGLPFHKQPRGIVPLDMRD
ncbi:hypothetical protein Hanom_Chr11g01025321 [Helianthus anomalus]